MGKQFEDVGRAFGQCRTADGPDYWDDPDGRHADHRRHVRNLSILTLAIVVAAVVFDPVVAGLLVVITPLLALEWFMLRRTGTRQLDETPASATDVEIELKPRE